MFPKMEIVSPSHDYQSKARSQQCDVLYPNKHQMGDKSLLRLLFLNNSSCLDINLLYSAVLCVCNQNLFIVQICYARWVFKLTFNSNFSDIYHFYRICTHCVYQSQLPQYSLSYLVRFQIDGRPVLLLIN